MEIARSGMFARIEARGGGREAAKCLLRAAAAAASAVPRCTAVMRLLLLLLLLLLCTCSICALCALLGAAYRLLLLPSPLYVCSV